MPRSRYRFTEEDVPIVHCWVHVKLRDAAWLQHEEAHTTWDQFPREQPTVMQLQQWCDQYLDAIQWTQLQAVIRAAQRDARQTRTVRLSTRAYTLLHDLATREQLTLSETTERYLADVAVIPQPQDISHTTKQTPAKQTADTRVPKQSMPAATSSQKHGSAFITTKKGGRYLTIKIGRYHFSIMRIYNYTIDAQDKRDMRQLHLDVDFDWKKIARQLVEKREVCRRYRSRQRTTRVLREHEPFYGVFEPHTRGVYVNDLDNIAGVSALFDSLLSSER
jgi:hypothetical protein